MIVVYLYVSPDLCHLHFSWQKLHLCSVPCSDRSRKLRFTKSGANLLNLTDDIEKQCDIFMSFKSVKTWFTFTGCDRNGQYNFKKYFNNIPSNKVHLELNPFPFPRPYFVFSREPNRNQ